MNTLDPIKLRSAFGNYMTGVTVVTASDESGTPVGFTANSFTSVSLDPPLLLVCAGNHLSSINVFRNCDRFAVNILAEGQEEISETFASSRADRFSDVDWRSDSGGAPLILDALTTFSCSKHSVVEAGDHLVLIGEVTEFETKDGLGLGYCRDGYFSLSKERQAETTGDNKQNWFIGALVEFEDRVFVTRENGSLRLPQIRLPNDTKASDAIYRYLDQMGLNVEIGPIYSLFHEATDGHRFIYFRAKAPSEKCGAQGEYLSIVTACQADWQVEAEATMVRRFADERNHNAFGLYIGDADAGEIQAND